MKKSLFSGLIALAALTMTSCSNDENMLSIPQDNAIEFGTYIGRDAQTKGVVLNDDNLSDFGVYAFYTSGAGWTESATPNFMYGQKVARTSAGANWTYTPKKYWPTKNTNEYISFFAFAPYYTTDNGIAINSLNNATGTPTLTYSIATDKLDKLADFTADVVMNATKGQAGVNPDNSNHDITFDFKHELTRVAITAQLDRKAFGDEDANKTKVNVKQIDFTGTGFATQAVYKFASTSDAKGTWTYTAATNALQIVAGADGSVLENKNTEIYWIPEYTIPGYLLKDGSEQNLFGQDNYLFLIPPTQGGVTDDNAVSMHIYYDIVTQDSKLANGHSVSSAVKEIVIPAGLLAQGSAYNFNLIFNLNEIVFKANVVNWEPGKDFENNVDWPKNDK